MIPNRMTDSEECPLLIVNYQWSDSDDDNPVDTCIVGPMLAHHDEVDSDSNDGSAFLSPPSSESIQQEPVGCSPSNPENLPALDLQFNNTESGENETILRLHRPHPSENHLLQRTCVIRRHI